MAGNESSLALSLSLSMVWFKREIERERVLRVSNGLSKANKSLPFSHLPNFYGQ